MMKVPYCLLYLFLWPISAHSWLWFLSPFFPLSPSLLYSLKHLFLVSRRDTARTACLSAGIYRTQSWEFSTWSRWFIQRRAKASVRAGAQDEVVLSPKDGFPLSLFLECSSRGSTPSVRLGKQFLDDEEKLRQWRSYVNALGSADPDDFAITSYSEQFFTTSDPSRKYIWPQ